MLNSVCMQNKIRVLLKQYSINWLENILYFHYNKKLKHIWKLGKLNLL